MLKVDPLYINILVRDLKHEEPVFVNIIFRLIFGAQFVYFENRYNEEEKINFDEISSSIVTIESLNNRGKVLDPE